ncbi:MAG: hypothetical protein RL210_414 [Pseudomonadota bacterium]
MGGCTWFLKVNMLHKYGPALGVLALLLTGCALVPPANLSSARFDYGSELAESWKRQTLMNVVRLRYNDVPAFLDVSGVVTSDSRSASANAGVSLVRPVTENTTDLGVSGSWSSAPTISYQPMAGERFSKRVLEPMSPISVLMLVQAGWPIDMVWPTMVSSVNGLHSQSLGNPADPGFTELQQVLSRIQQSHAVGFRLRPKEEGDALMMVLHREHVPKVAADLKAMRKLLGLQPGANSLVVTFGEVPRNDREMAINTRSMLEVLQELGSGIELPEAHVRQGRALPFAHAEAESGDAPYQPLVSIRSGRAAPADSYAAIPYKGYWFWIEDDDHRSKRLFSFLMMLLSLAETGQPAAPPVLTISTGR